MHVRKKEEKARADNGRWWSEGERPKTSWQPDAKLPAEGGLVRRNIRSGRRLSRSPVTSDSILGVHVNFFQSRRVLRGFFFGAIFYVSPCDHRKVSSHWPIL